MLTQGLLLPFALLLSSPLPAAPQADQTQAIRVPFANTPSADWMILVDATYEGKKSFLTILDTGAAVGVVEPPLAKELALKPGVEISANDGGGKSVKTRITSVGSVRLGGAEITGTPFIVIALPDGAPAKAVVGVQLFQKYAVRVDQTRRELLLIPHAQFKPDPRAARVPLEFHAGGRSVIEAVVDGVKGKFLLDTGNNGALILNADFIDRNGLNRKHKLLDRGDGGRTVVGKRSSLVGRVDSLKIGEFTISRPVTSFLKESGAAEKDLAGNIGMEVMRQFDATFDFQGKTLYLEPNANFGVAIPYERVGLVCERIGNGYKVTNILPKSGADLAGIKVGDQVVTLNGTPVQRIDGLIRKALFRGAPGTKLKIGYRRKGKPFMATVVLKDLL